MTYIFIEELDSTFDNMTQVKEELKTELKRQNIEQNTFITLHKMNNNWLYNGWTEGTLCYGSKRATVKKILSSPIRWDECSYG